MYDVDDAIVITLLIIDPKLVTQEIDVVHYKSYFCFT